MKLGGELRLRAEWWVIAVLTSALVAYMTVDRSLTRPDNLVYDSLLRLAPDGVAQDIVLVTIDDASLAQVGRWPWSRQTHAKLIRQINEMRPRAIAYDVLFTEPSDPEQDAELGLAIGETERIFVPLSLSATDSKESSYALTEPIPPVRQAASGVGYTNLEVGIHGVVRSAPLALGNNPPIEHLMELMHRVVRPDSTPGHTPALIPFGAPAGSWPSVRASALLAGQVQAPELQNKLVIVGVTAAGIASRYPVPSGGVMSGAEIEAHLLHGLINGRMITPASTLLRLLFALLPLWLLMLALGYLPRIPAWLAFAALMLVVLAASAIGLGTFKIWVPPSVAIVGLGIAYPLWGWRQLAVTHNFMRAELRRFQTEPALFPDPAPGTNVDDLSSTIMMLRGAIARGREIRHFVADRLDQLPDATLVTHVDGSVLMSNPAAAHLLDARGTPPRIEGNVQPYLEQFRQADTGGPVALPPGESDSMNVEGRTAEGRFFAIRFAMQRSTAGDFMGWIIQFQDISEAKAAQRQRDDILQLLTHDMRSPQASILAVLDTVAPGNIAAEEARRIRYYAERTLRLADGFVQLARAESLDYTIEEIDLGDMLMDAIDDLWPQLKIKGIATETEERDARLIVRGERSLLTRALINVLGNAIKYSADNSRIVCTLGTEAGANGALLATCAIRDEGPGMTDEQVQRIFERFHRVPLGVGPKVDGVGLGLSFVHTVMVRHGGDIRCESEPGRGSTFTFVLPLSDPAEANCSLESDP